MVEHTSVSKEPMSRAKRARLIVRDVVVGGAKIGAIGVPFFIGGLLFHQHDPAIFSQVSDGFGAAWTGIHGAFATGGPVSTGTQDVSVQSVDWMTGINGFIKEHTIESVLGPVLVLEGIHQRPRIVGMVRRLKLNEKVEGAINRVKTLRRSKQKNTQ